VIPIGDLDGYLKRLLAEANDSEIDAAFPQTVRFRAIQEAALAVARLRPDAYAQRVELPYDPAQDAFFLSQALDYLLEVVGIRIDGQVHSLRASSDAERIKDDPCWRQNRTDIKTPEYFVWNPTSPRLVVVDGYQPDATIVAVASNLGTLPVDGNASEINAPYSFFPDIIDHALARCYSLEDTSAGESSFYQQRFTQGVGNKVSTDQARNPMVAALMRTERFQ